MGLFREVQMEVVSVMLVLFVMILKVAIVCMNSNYYHCLHIELIASEFPLIISNA